MVRTDPGSLSVTTVARVDRGDNPRDRCGPEHQGQPGGDQLSMAAMPSAKATAVPFRRLRCSRMLLRCSQARHGQHRHHAGALGV
jgi:hypothetical protein